MTLQPDALMIFCAGLGTRMRPLTDDRPKSLVEVGGVTLLDHALDTVGTQRPTTRVANVHAHADQMRTAAAHRGFVVSEEPVLLDTGGGLKAAAALLGSDAAFTLNADAIWAGSPALDTLVNAWDPHRMDALLLVAPMARALAHQGSGDFDLDPEGRLLRGSSHVYTGAQIIALKPVLARSEDVFSLNLVWNDIAEAGRLFGAVHPGDWCDVGHPDAIPIAEELLGRIDA